MAVTETPPETVDAASEMAAPAPRPHPTGLAAVLGTGDHKVIGRLYLASSLIFGLLVLGLGQAVAVEAITPETLQVFSADIAYQAFTLLRVGTVFLLALPLVIGIAMVVVPLQVGARSIAFPRAAAASYWGWLVGAVLLVAAYLINGGPGGGSDNGVNLWIAAMGLLVLSVLLAAICLATTVLSLRTPGMTLDRVPLYAWSVAVASIMWLLTLPVLFGHLVLMYIDHRHAGGISVGSSDSLLGAVSWVLRNPQIYVIAIPVLGFVADVLATTAGARMKLRSVAQGAIAAFGVLGFGAFLAIPSQTALESPIVVMLALAALLPILALAAACADVFRTGSFSLNAGVLYAVASLLVLALGVAAGALGGITASDTAGTVYDLGVNHAVVLAAVIGSLGAVHWWASKVGRQPAGEGLGKLAPLVLLVGSATVVLPDLISGLAGEGLELAPDYTGGIPALNVVAAIGVAVVALGLAIAVISLLPLLKRPEGEVAADPWGGQTLEWRTASPPTLANFDDELAVVTSAEPLIDLREEK